ncbi:MAG: cyclic nucleotide-binding domain-containing protein [Armatimonadetes bacterium]|nr:cyclic nucleotide-binding domain-containing protein [Armatimonadota bacterium]
MALWGSKSSKVALLRKVPLFDGLSERQLEQVSQLADEIEVPEGKRLATAGETGRELFVIVDGRATVKTPRGRTVRLGRGDFFGEMSLIDGGPRSASVTADGPMKLLVVGQREFWALLSTASSISKKIMSALAARLRDADAAFSQCP